jgi:hypothetical protein
MSKRRVDFGDENAVLKEVAKAVDLPWDQLKIRSSRGYGGFGVGDVYEITHAWSHTSYYVVENEEVADDLAIEIVKQDLEESPENFNREFIEQHIDTKRLADQLHSDVYDSNWDMCNDEAEHNPDDFWSRYEGDGFDAPEEDDEGNRREPKSKEVQELAESLTEEQLKDPMAYLEDIYGREDAVKKAIEIAGIDVEEAAKEAVGADGPGHFLSSYDGATHVTPAGLVYWRQN